MPGRAFRRIIRRVRALALVTLCFVAPCRATAQTAKTRTTTSGLALRGMVVRQTDASPVVGAEVWLPFANKAAQTNAAGEFEFDSLPDGVQFIQIRQVGFDVLRDTVRIDRRGDGMRTAIYVLTASAQRLDTVRTVSSGERYLSPALRAFEERRRANAGGYFISDSVLRRSESSTMANVIVAHIPGVTWYQNSQDATLVSSRKQCRGAVFIHNCRDVPDCYVSVYIDGVLDFYPAMVDRGFIKPPDFSHMSPHDYAGVEFYPGGAAAPIEMHPRDDEEGCGSIWLWTREK